MHRFLGFLGPPGRSYAPFLRGLSDRYMSVTSRFRGLGHAVTDIGLLCSRVVGRVLSPSISTTKCTQLLCLVSLVLVVPSHFPADPCRLMDNAGDGLQGVVLCLGCLAESRFLGGGVVWYGWHAPFLILAGAKSMQYFLMGRFLNART